jgi:hypothetical protein
MTDKNTLMRLQSGGRDAGKIFGRALDGAEEEVREIRAIVRANPETAMVALQNTGATGLSPKGEADALDFILGEVSDSGRARQMMGDHLTPERRVELLQGRGDLPATAAYLADPEDILMALLAEVYDDLTWQSTTFSEEDFVSVMISLRAWAHKLKDREDWGDILELEIGEQFTVREFLLADLWIEQESPSVASLPADIFVELGLEPDDDRHHLQEMVDEDRVPEFRPGVIEEARKRLAEKRRAIKEMPTMAESARSKIGEDDLF